MWTNRPGEPRASRSLHSSYELVNLMELTASIVITLGALIGVVLTALTLPGMWLAVLVALVCVAVRPDSMHWGFLLAACGLAVLGEVAEFGASAAGAATVGGSKSGAVGSMVGGLVGALAGTVLLPIPIVGTIAGAVVGAGVGAVIGERGHAERPWKESITVGGGAAAGRLVSVVVKSVIAGVMALVLIVGAWI